MNEENGDSVKERRRKDDAFLAALSQRLDRIDRAMFDEQGHSNIRSMAKEQHDMHKENDNRLDRLERSLFNEQGESRMVHLEAGQSRILDAMSKAKFLIALMIGAFTLFSPLATQILSLFLHK